MSVQLCLHICCYLRVPWAAPTAFSFRGTPRNYPRQQKNGDQRIQWSKFAHSQSLQTSVLARVKKGWITCPRTGSMGASDLSPAAIDDQFGPRDIACVIGG